MHLPWCSQPLPRGGAAPCSARASSPSSALVHHLDGRRRRVAPVRPLPAVHTAAAEPGSQSPAKFNSPWDNFGVDPDRPIRKAVGEENEIIDKRITCRRGDQPHRGYVVAGFPWVSLECVNPACQVLRGRVLLVPGIREPVTGHFLDAGLDARQPCFTCVHDDMATDFDKVLDNDIGAAGRGHGSMKERAEQRACFEHGDPRTRGEVENAEPAIVEPCSSAAYPGREVCVLTGNAPVPALLRHGSPRELTGIDGHHENAPSLIAEMAFSIAEMVFSRASRSLVVPSRSSLGVFPPRSGLGSLSQSSSANSATVSGWTPVSGSTQKFGGS